MCVKIYFCIKFDVCEVAVGRGWDRGGAMKGLGGLGARWGCRG